MSPFITTARNILDTTDKVEKYAAMLPLLCEIAVVPGVVNWIGHSILDIAEALPSHKVMDNMANRATKLAVELIPLGTLIGDAIGLNKVVQTGLSRFWKPHLVAFRENGPARAWHALKYDEIPAPPEDSHEHKADLTWKKMVASEPAPAAPAIRPAFAPSGLAFQPA